MASTQGTRVPLSEALGEQAEVGDYIVYVACWLLFLVLAPLLLGWEALRALITFLTPTRRPTEATADLRPSTETRVAPPAVREESEFNPIR